MNSHKASNEIHPKIATSYWCLIFLLMRQTLIDESSPARILWNMLQESFLELCVWVLTLPTITTPLKGGLLSSPRHPVKIMSWSKYTTYNSMFKTQT